MCNTFIFTIMSQDGPGWFDLLRSAQKWGWSIQPRYLGGEKWRTDPVKGIIPTPPITQASYEEFIDNKHLYMRKEIERAYHKGYTRYFYLDGWDTKIIGDFAEVPFDSPLFFSAEGPHPTLSNQQMEGCYPDVRYAEFYPRDGRTYPYINAGVQWGWCSAYLDRCPTYTCLDQLVWTREYVTNPNGITLDTEAKTAFNLYGLLEQNVWSRKEVGGRWTFLPTGGVPCVVHGNGKWAIPGWLN